MTRSIKLSDLRRADACAEQVKLFAELFPDGATFSTEAEAVAAALSVADRFNWWWAARNLLSLSMWESYKEMTRKVRADYWGTNRKSRQAYYAVMAETFARAWWNDKADKEDGR